MRLAAGPELKGLRVAVGDAAFAYDAVAAAEPFYQRFVMEVRNKHLGFLSEFRQPGSDNALADSQIERLPPRSSNLRLPYSFGLEWGLTLRYVRGDFRPALRTVPPQTSSVRSRPGYC